MRKLKLQVERAVSNGIGAASSASAGVGEEQRQAWHLFGEGRAKGKNHQQDKCTGAPLIAETEQRLEIKTEPIQSSGEDETKECLHPMSQLRAAGLDACKHVNDLLEWKADWTGIQALSCRQVGKANKNRCCRHGKQPAAVGRGAESKRREDRSPKQLRPWPRRS
eukprot:s840_g6.t1